MRGFLTKIVERRLRRHRHC